MFPLIAFVPALIGAAVTVVILINRFLKLYQERNQVFREYVETQKKNDQKA